ncbi:MAG TPA: hypothetical protein VFH38_07355 [Jatrophihabitans sp.]|nr:hypothetical protein [Jatrophihabitans sp.]
MSRIAFEIRVRGIVDAQQFADLQELAMTTMPASTTMIGEAADQAALVGLLARLRAHGLVVTEVHRLDPAPPRAD